MTESQVETGSRGCSDGGPVFPLSRDAIQIIASARSIGITDANERERVYLRACADLARGMSLRDYLAGLAMPTLLANLCEARKYAELPAGGPLDELMGVGDVASDAYAIADAMLAARSETRGAGESAPDGGRSDLLDYARAHAEFDALLAAHGGPEAVNLEVYARKWGVPDSLTIQQWLLNKRSAAIAMATGGAA